MARFRAKISPAQTPSHANGIESWRSNNERIRSWTCKDGQLIAFVDLSDDHCATCFGDGLQVIMGTTFGIGNLKNTYKANGL